MKVCNVTEHILCVLYHYTRKYILHQQTMQTTKEGVYMSFVFVMLTLHLSP